MRRRRADGLPRLSGQGTPAIAVDCKTGKGVGGFVPLLRGVLQDKIAAWQAKGMKNHPIRVMVVGIPNVGKSSFINRMARGGRAKVEDRARRDPQQPVVCHRRRRAAAGYAGGALAEI